MAESVKVIVRSRPMNAREKDLKCKTCVFVDPSIMQCSLVNVNDQCAPPKNFTFDGVYGVDSTTEAIYNEITYPLVEGVLEGYNGTVFAYGQTGCGKSFTMQGIQKPATQRGIIPRSFEHIFEAIDSGENMKYLVHASYLEIYNEDIRDLVGKDVTKKLSLKEHPDKGVYVADISMHPVHNVSECEILMEKGWKSRATGATKMNAESSRSHSIFTINIEMMDTSAAVKNQHIRKGKLNLVDLAGSERQAKTEATGDRLKEATKINLSLSALGNVISALVDGKSKHIPYRDSKLTRLLQDSLGGNTKTMMVACLSPADNNYDETLSTLRYANRAKNIKNKPKINEDPKDAMLREYQDEIKKLKAMLDGQPLPGMPGFSEEKLEQERTRMRSEHEKEMEAMRKKMESEKRSKDAMQMEVSQMKKQYEAKLKELEVQAQRARTAQKRGTSAVITNDKGEVVSVVNPKNGTAVSTNKSTPASGVPMNQMQQEAMVKLKQLQEEMIEGGKRAGDKNLKERRKQKKKAAESRLKALGEALGHVDDEDGVLLKVYDDIQEELRVKTEALKKSKQKVKGLNSEIRDLQYEFESDRTDYLDTIRKQDQQLILMQQLLERVQPMIRKDCNYCNLERIKNEAVWNDETQRWKIPELVMQKTKLPPAGTSGAQTTKRTGVSLLKKPQSHHQASDQDTDEDIEDISLDSGGEQHLQQKLAKSEEEDIVGTYFKPQRANHIMAQAQETKRKGGLSKPNSTNGSSLSASNLSNKPLSSSYNSGLNTFGLNNSYAASNNSLNNNLSNGGSPLNNGYNSSILGPYNTSSDLGGFRKPSRLEALPTVDKNRGRKKSSGPILNTMGTF